MSQRKPKRKPKLEPSRDLYRLIQKKGTHLASSNDTDGAFRGILFDDDTNKLVAHAEWEKVDESEYESDFSNDYQENQQKVELSLEEQKAAQLAGEELAAFTMYILTEYVAPHVIRWWQNDALPAMKEMRKIFIEKYKEKLFQKSMKKPRLRTGEIVSASGTVSGMFSYVLEEAYEKYMNDMTSEEAQRELLDIFILSALLTAKIRKLSTARIKNSGAVSEEFFEGQKILERLTAPEYIGSINQILESNPELMEEKTEALSAILGRNLALNGQYVPIDIGKFQEAMTLEVDACDDGQACAL